VVLGESDEPLSSETETSHEIKGRGVTNQSESLYMHEGKGKGKKKGRAVHINSFASPHPLELLALRAICADRRSPSVSAKISATAVSMS